MSGLRERVSRAYVDGYERGPKHPALHPVIFAAGLFVLILVTGISTGDAQGAAIVAAALLAYLLPVLVAWGRRRRNPGQVVVVNLLLGWTVIGWVVALVMALGERERPSA